MELLDKDTIKNLLHEKVCKVTFTKINGEERVMYCTLNESMIPSDGAVAETKRTKKENVDAQAVYDVKASGWRSFRWDLVKDFTSELNA
jgi:hypothetical protein